MNPGITTIPFGTFEGKEITEYTLTNENGMQVSVMNYGATITKIITPDRHGNLGNTILGFDSIDEYVKSAGYIGSTVGRYCNRIANGRFILDGEEYQLAKNHNGNNLHGGIKGFDKCCWNAEKMDDNCSIKMIYLGKDGEEGFPGNLQVQMIYSLSPDNELKIDYSATTDKTTHVNLTNHAYFNLCADNKSSILDHELKLFSTHYTLNDDNMIPTGEIATVKGTALDFSTTKKIGKDIQQMKDCYDHNFVLDDPGGKAAEVYDPSSGRFMEMYTSEPGVQLYTGNSMHFCLEAQHYPNSPNEPTFPSTILRPGETYNQLTVYKFSAK